jgi:predicted kinase
LIIVNGAPASGKSSLAESLGEQLGFPTITRDAIKESLVDSLGAPDETTLHELGAAAYSVLSVIVDRLLQAGVSIVIESNFSHGVGERDLLPFLQRARAMQIICEAPADVLVDRYRERDEQGERHPGHQEATPETLEDLETSIVDGRYDPLKLDIPLIRVDTTDGFDPTIEELVAMVQSMTGLVNAE